MRGAGIGWIGSEVGAYERGGRQESRLPGGGRQDAG